MQTSHRGGLRAVALVIAGMMSVAAAHAELAGPMRIASVDAPGVAEATSEAAAEQISARVDLSEQRMRIYVGMTLVHEFVVSTGRKGYDTPTGRYRVTWIHPKWRSRQYEMTPMPWSVFFHGGYAFHGTNAVSRLGRPASHGCVRLDPKDARTFYRLVEAGGLENTIVSVVR